MPGWTISEKPIDKKYGEIYPGPGHYSNIDYDRDGKAFTMQGKHDIPDKSVVPGPGSYNIK